MKVAVTVTNPDKILFPKSKITKGEFFEYHAKIAKKMLPWMKGRPVSMLRFPNGINGEVFYQKNVSEYFPKWIKTCSIKRQGLESIRMVVCNDVDTLLYLANQVCTPHLWLSQSDKLNYPDRLIFDFDPPTKEGFPLVMKAALECRAFVEKKLGLKAFVMTTGSKGLHVVIPIKREYEFSEVRSFARKIALYMEKQNSDGYTTELNIKKRRGRLFLDYLRNSLAQTAVAPYAVRPIEGAPVATPIDWKELKRGLNSQSFTIKNVLKRKKDPWKSLERSAVSLKTPMKKLESLISQK
ncbi:MAG TPA: non-homologous end-joining DNA ligase [Chlamydiales bacterium]|nr:non-homologous end-joining DNA ligase [Chlamydiales bacterium]